MRKIWCKHIKWLRGAVLGSRWRIKVIENCVSLPGWVDVPRSWKVCPICEAQRPTRENIAAAELRFAMDND